MRHLNCAYVKVRQRKMLKGSRQRNYFDRSKSFTQIGYYFNNGLAICQSHSHILWSTEDSVSKFQ